MANQKKLSIETDKPKENSLYNWCIANHNEKLLDEWDYEANGEFNPNNVAKASNTKFAWICSKCGHKWMSTPSHRTCGRRCPKCSKKRVADRYSTVNDRNDSVLAKYPEVAKEWDYEKNSRGPETYYPRSNLKVWWKCSKCGHEWETSIEHRCTRNNGCPVCGGYEIVKGVNDLFTIQPNLKNEWDFDKNKIDPYTIGVGSHEYVWWKCDRGHSWQAVVYSRTSKNHSGCPECSKERRTSLPEKVIYFYVKKYFPNAEENYHLPFLDKKELDIFIPSLSIGIEYDGCAWHKDKKKDVLKDELCAKNGIKVIRIREQGLDDYDSPSIKLYTGKYKSDCLYLTKTIEELLNLLDIKNPIVGIENDYETIFSSYATFEKENSIANHSMISEWDYEKNKNIDPKLIPIQSNRKFWWKCSTCGYEWKVSPAHRARGHKCPLCSNQVVKKGVNDLLSQNPTLANEWDYENNKLNPDEVTYKSNKKYWWVCSKCGHRWKTTIYVRHSGCGCPECKKNVISEKQSKANYEESLLFKFPEIANEWNLDKNDGIKPEDVYANSNHKYWWKCKKCGNSWEAVVSSRTNGKNGCPYCSGRFAIKGVNDLATLKPDLVDEWDFDENKIKPDEVKIGSSRDAYWICKKCGYKWKTKINVRTRGCGCPRCAGKIK